MPFPSGIWTCPFSSRSPSSPERTSADSLVLNAGWGHEWPPPNLNFRRHRARPSAPRWRSLRARCACPSRTRRLPPPPSRGVGRGKGGGPAQQAPAREESGEPSWRNETLLKTENRANQGLQTGMWRTRSKTKQQNGEGQRCGRTGWGGWSESWERGEGSFSSHFFKKPTQGNTHRTVCSRVET